MSKKNGFTLIELLVVLFIISLLASLVIVNVSQARKSSRDAKRVANLKSIQTALEMYYEKYKAYPYTTTTPPVKTCNPNGGAITAGDACLGGNAAFKPFFGNGIVPTEPKTGWVDYYYWPKQVEGDNRTEGQGYTLLARCETTCSEGFKWSYATDGPVPPNLGYGVNGYYALTSSIE